MLVTAED